jgi:membrane protein DedA with SNARE-associated domain
MRFEHGLDKGKRRCSPAGAGDLFFFWPGVGVVLWGMNLSEIAHSFEQLWENKPGAVVLFILGFVVFVFLVVDTWIHKRRRKKPR